jgi:enoyl-[acyl-carrier protein] reductase II
MVLIPMVRQAVDLPLLAAGGIGTGQAMAAALALGADGVQVGSRFVATPESSAHPAFKQAVLDAQEGDTQLTLKELTPVRLLKNPFYEELQQAYARHATPDELKLILGRARAKRGMFEGDLQGGELEIGQVAGLIHQNKPAAAIVYEMMQACQATIASLQGLQ